MAVRIDDAGSEKKGPKRLGVERMTYVSISEIVRILEPIGIKSKAVIRRMAEEGSIRVTYPFPSDVGKNNKKHPRYCIEDAQRILREQNEAGEL
jgi:hypothetical protein